MDEPQLTYRIGWISGFLMVGMAVVADLLQILFTLTVVFAPAGDIITVFTEGFIFLFFVFRGVKIFSGRRSLSRGLTLFGQTIIELVPFVDALPTLSLGTLYQIHSTRVEDTERFEERHAQWEAAMRQQQEDEEIAYAQAVAQARIQAANDDEEAGEYREAA